MFASARLFLTFSLPIIVVPMSIYVGSSFLPHGDHHMRAYFLYLSLHANFLTDLLSSPFLYNFYYFSWDINSNCSFLQSCKEDHSKEWRSGGSCSRFLIYKACETRYGPKRQFKEEETMYDPLDSEEIKLPYVCVGQPCNWGREACAHSGRANDFLSF